MITMKTRRRMDQLEEDLEKLLKLVMPYKYQYCNKESYAATEEAQQPLGAEGDPPQS